MIGPKKHKLGEFNRAQRHASTQWLQPASVLRSSPIDTLAPERFARPNPERTLRVLLRQAVCEAQRGEQKPPRPSSLSLAGD